jgi:hypothetical protein
VHVLSPFSLSPFSQDGRETPDPYVFRLARARCYTCRSVEWLGSLSLKARAYVLTCLPQSLCSWNYRVVGAEAGLVELSFNWFTEQGSIHFGEDEFEVRKHGPLSGHWTLEHDGQVVAAGRKPSAMFRSFDLSMAGVNFTVKAQSPLTRCYEILFEGRAVGTIWPAHLFTRRAFIECNSQVPELVQVFAFWLAAITWRRAAKNSQR